MKSIENSTVLNTWALLVDFLNEHWFIATATSTEIFICAFMVSWCFSDADNESTGYKESYLTELFKLPCHRAESKIFRTATNLVSKRAKFNVDFPKSGSFRKTSRSWQEIGLSLSDSSEIARVFCKQTRFGIVPTRKADPDIFLIAPKQN